MSAVLQNLVNQPYKHGFVTDIESDVGDETVFVRLIDQILQHCTHLKLLLYLTPTSSRPKKILGAR